jgi:hypothetical protein
LALQLAKAVRLCAIIAVGAYNTASITISAYLNVARDGSTVAEWNREAPNTAGWRASKSSSDR